MSIQNIPDIYLSAEEESCNLFTYNFKMTEDILKSKVNLTLNMLCFLQKGEKKIHFEDSFVKVNNRQSLIVKSGNCLMTELLKHDEIYFCKLVFFSNKMAKDFLEKHDFSKEKVPVENPETPFFTIENDEFIDSFATSISAILNVKEEMRSVLLAPKFEEIMLYLAHKCGASFINYLRSLAAISSTSSIRKVVEANKFSNLSLAEIAFLANMSLSTFKRKFEDEYQAKPGKWLKQKRLNEAKDLLQKRRRKPSEIYAEFGYTNLSNFSIAFKNEFGVSPKSIYSNK